jgi:hypothetical protein
LYFEYENGAWGPKRDEVFAADGSQLAPTDFDSRFDSMSRSALVLGPIIRDKVWFIASY